MRLYWLLFLLSILCSCETNLVSQDKQKEVEVSQVDSLSLDSVVPVKRITLSSDSFLLRIRFRDVDNNVIKQPTSFLTLSTTSVCEFSTNNDGLFESIMPRDAHSIVVGKDTFSLISACDTFQKELLLPIHVIRGKIMETDGTPIVSMPLRIHCLYPIRGRKKQEHYDQDILVYTDSLGCYLSYVPVTIKKVQIRCCGFSVGTVTNYELMHYPTQNFLFVPVEMDNIWGDYIPPYEYYFESSEASLISINNRDELFQHESELESLDKVKIVAKYKNSVLRRKCSKRDNMFRNALFKISLRMPS